MREINIKWKKAPALNKTNQQNTPSPSATPAEGLFLWIKLVIAGLLKKTVGSIFHTPKGLNSKAQGKDKRTAVRNPPPWVCIYI
jgi:hypothetical protein